MINITCVGDSLTYGYLVEDREINCYPAVLNELLGDEYVVGNFGVNGCTMLKTSPQPYWSHENFKLSAMTLPDIVIIMLGTNDSMPHQFTSMDDFTQTYEEMIHHYRGLSSRPRVYIATPPTVFSEMSEICGETVNQMAAAIKALGKKLRVSVIDINKKTENSPECFVADGVHTNKNGAKLIANAVFRELTKK